MGMPTDIGIIDTMIGFPMRDTEAVYEFIKKQTKDADSKQSEFPAEYMFKQAPKQHEGDEDPVAITLREMDKFGVERGLIGVHNDEGKRALQQHPDRFIPSMSADPNDGVEGLRKIVRNYEEFGIRAVGVFPCGTFPQVAINDKLMYPIYAKCCELDIAAFVNAGVPGPRLKYDAAEGGVPRRGDVRLPRAHARDPPRVRAVDRARGEAHVEVARASTTPRARSPRSTTRRTSSTSPTRAAPTRSSTRATTRWVSRSSAS